MDLNVTQNQSSDLGIKFNAVVLRPNSGYFSVNDILNNLLQGKVTQTIVEPITTPPHVYGNYDSYNIQDNTTGTR